MPRTEDVNQQIRDERRQQILKAAAQLFLEKGLANLKISDLATAVGMSQGLLYRYFANKEDLFTGVVENYAQDMRQHFQQALEQPGDATQKLYWLTQHFLTDIQAHAGRHQILQQALSHPGRACGLVQDMKSVMKESLRELITQGQAEKGIVAEPVDALIVLFLGIFQGLASGLHFFGLGEEGHLPDADLIFRLFRA